MKCILPWINFSTTTFGRPRVCGYSEDSVVKKNNRNLKNSSIDEEWNNEYFRRIRLDFLNNNWPKNCKRCEYVENLGGVSKRIEENKGYYSKYQNLIAKTNDIGEVPYTPPHIDVRTGTICNLKCIHCGTGASSKWSEDTLLLNKYENTGTYNINHKWIEQDSSFWNTLRARWQDIKKYNFLGGESFANKQHNLFIQDLSQTEFARNVTLCYTTNALLLTEKILQQLENFSFVSLRVSLDAVHLPLEYFRYPTKWHVLEDKLDLLNRFCSNKNNIELNFQWTCSNISIFYLSQTYEEVKKYKNFHFLFCNHVEWPVHMSAQNLPNALKKYICKDLENFKFLHGHEKDVNFYMQHMNKKDNWKQHSKIFFNYLDDLDIARNMQWKTHFQEMNLGIYDER